MNITIDTSDPGKAADIAARAAILFATVSGFNAENTMRERDGYQIAYPAQSYEDAIIDCFPGMIKFEKDEP